MSAGWRASDFASLPEAVWLLAVSFLTAKIARLANWFAVRLQKTKNLLRVGLFLFSCRSVITVNGVVVCLSSFDKSQVVIFYFLLRHCHRSTLVSCGLLLPTYDDMRRTTEGSLTSYLLLAIYHFNLDGHNSVLHSYSKRPYINHDRSLLN